MMKVRFFAQVAAFARSSEIDLPVEQGITGRELWARLEAALPGIGQFQGFTRLARNFAYVDGGALLAEGDEIALLPPVSGG